MSRPHKEIDWKKVDDLLMAGCLGTEIAPHFDLHPKTFYSRFEEHYNTTFTAYAAEKRAQGASLIRAQQYAKALGLTNKGDNTLLIWLGKVRCEQRESIAIPEQPKNQADIDKDHKIMELENKINELTNNANKPKTE